VAVAQGLVEGFPDGIYFVPLATVTTAEVMWTTIAEVLDVPPERRIPPEFFEHVAHRSALFVLDNLEQVSGADDVVAELLYAAPEVVVIATSRRPLHVAGEHEHPVPPLELPDGADMAATSASGAVQMFVQHARLVRPSFAVTADNAADVSAVCRRLDGLPLAIELAAARTKLLSPHALLARLDQALDIAASASRGPSRQKTLRDTIDWSYDLLTSTQQTFFRRLGVFAGGADLDAINAVISVQDGADPLDLVAALVDASLVTVAEAADGEPRIGMLETVRAYARDQLVASGDLEAVAERHARHYLLVAEHMSNLLSGDEYAQVRARFEVEHDNLRAALAWALEPDRAADSTDDGRIGLRLCGSLDGFWRAGGYYAEARRWLERAVRNAGDSDGPQLARCLAGLGGALGQAGDLDAAHGYALASVQMWRRLHDRTWLPDALVVLATVEVQLRLTTAARSHLEDAVTLAREANDAEQLLWALGVLAILEGDEHNYERCLELGQEAVAIARAVGARAYILPSQHNMACTLRLMGRVEEAKEQMRSLIPQVLALNEPGLLVAAAEDYAAILADHGDHRRAIRLLGAADTLRSRIGLPRRVTQEAEIAEPIAKTRTALTAQEWTDTYQAGRNTTVEDAFAEVCAPTE
jgi:predicted ATPase